MKVQNFIKQITEIKEKDSLDLSSGEDLSIALMNLISLEEHFLFSYMKTLDTKYLNFLEQIRELRKKLLKHIVKKDNDSENWCISKHLLATAIRLSEVGTKFLHEGKKKEAEELFIESFNVYSMFWVINGAVKQNTLIQNSHNKPSEKEINIKETKQSKISQLIKKILDCCKE